MGLANVSKLSAAEATSFLAAACIFLAAARIWHAAVAASAAAREAAVDGNVAFTALQ